MSNDPQQVLDDRRRYVHAFNSTMIRIWREQIALLGAVDTGALYRSLKDVRVAASSDYTDVHLEQSFNEYGLYVDRGTGSNTYRNNSGDIGRDNLRRRKRWFSRKYWASVMNIQEFMADSMGQQICLALGEVLSSRNLP